MKRTASLDGAIVAFDLDGTLVDTAPDLVGALNTVLAEEGLRPLPMEDARKFIGHGARRLVERGFAAEGAVLAEIDAERLLKRFPDHYADHLADLSRPFPGAEAALDELSAAGARLVVCTNKRTSLSLAVLDALGLTRRFEAIVGADIAPAAKPDPRHLQMAVEKAGGDMARAVMVGDAVTDVGAARAAGAGLVLVSFGYTETPAQELDHDVLIHHFSQLPDACRQLVGV